MMGVIVGSVGKGTYKIAFSDSSDEDDVRCVGRNYSGWNETVGQENAGTSVTEGCTFLPHIFGEGGGGGGFNA